MASLGWPHKYYPIPWTALKYDTKLGGYRTGITESQLRDAPEFSDDMVEDRDWEIRTHTTARPLIGVLKVTSSFRGVFSPHLESQTVAGRNGIRFRLGELDIVVANNLDAVAPRVEGP